MMRRLNEMARFGDALECGKTRIDVELHGTIDRIYPPHDGRKIRRQFRKYFTQEQIDRFKEIFE